MLYCIYHYFFSTKRDNNGSRSQESVYKYVSLVASQY